MTSMLRPFQIEEKENEGNEDQARPIGPRPDLLAFEQWRLEWRGSAGVLEKTIMMAKDASSNGKVDVETS